MIMKHTSLKIAALAFVLPFSSTSFAGNLTLNEIVLGFDDDPMAIQLEQFPSAFVMGSVFLKSKSIRLTHECEASLKITKTEISCTSNNKNAKIADRTNKRVSDSDYPYITAEELRFASNVELTIISPTDKKDAHYLIKLNN